MRRLILFRHAKAEPGAAGTDDSKRGLTGRGRRDALAVGALLADAGLAPDLALVSSARRARETWTAAAPAFGEVRVLTRQALYNASPEAILGEVKEFEGEAETLMVVGHNPGLQELAVGLVAQAGGSAGDIRRLAKDFPTATAAVFSCDEAGRFALEALDHPDRARARGR
jgi:phosphohistidine phosphatase